MGGTDSILASSTFVQPPPPQVFGFTNQLNVVSWLPQYHDMGLIGIFLECLATGTHLVYMTPISFLQDPTIVRLSLPSIHRNVASNQTPKGPYLPIKPTQPHSGCKRSTTTGPRSPARPTSPSRSRSARRRRSSATPWTSPASSTWLCGVSNSFLHAHALTHAANP